MRGGDGGGHPRQVSVALDTPSTPSLTGKELCETGFLSHMTVRESSPKPGVDKALYLDSKIPFRPWMYYDLLVSQRNHRIFEQKGCKTHTCY